MMDTENYNVSSVTEARTFRMRDRKPLLVTEITLPGAVSGRI